ncbi:MAG: Na+/H+ antiporter subunit C [Candidatus Abyssobacteria bacterium SURF_5]|uniref:Na+/H+ antiporter subunit C n=1 Tax=Abyssobacteria bacterium (strain SURF_5) TaxID=2093360 RepID=A0A3A4P1A1_ABYX5|nr:MAG: Na+/H+ antiporter subunit C [Candidatus Abyssubacteria bacterium SURF_5]
MGIVLPLIIGGLYAAGLYLMMRRSIVKLFLGLALLSHGANLLIFLMGGLVRGNSPIVPLGMTEPLTPYADPVPQALILTAIVIGFGMQAFLVVLIRRTHQATGTSDLDQLRNTDVLR